MKDKIPFATLQEELSALQEKSEWYESKITAMKIQAKMEPHLIRVINKLANERCGCLKVISTILSTRY